MKPVTEKQRKFLVKLQIYLDRTNWLSDDVVNLVKTSSMGYKNVEKIEMGKIRNNVTYMLRWKSYSTEHRYRLHKIIYMIQNEICPFHDWNKFNRELKEDNEKTKVVGTSNILS